MVLTFIIGEYRILHMELQIHGKSCKIKQIIIYYNLNHLGSDRQDADSARALRLPGTINSKNEVNCEVLYIYDDLREQDKKETIESIKELYEKGYRQVDIVRELGLSKGRVS